MGFELYKHWWAALAASLYYMLTGESPRHLPDGGDLVDAVVNTGAIPIRERNLGVPSRLAAVIDEALIDNPRIGIGSAAELAAALRDAAFGDAPPAPSAP